MRVVLILIIFLFFSCTNETNTSQHHTFINGIWNTDSILTFDFLLKDSTKIHEIEIAIRHDISYSFQNLLFFLINEEKVDTINLIMCEKNGKWYGEGIGDIRNISYKLKKDVVFNTSTPNIKIEQAMRYGGLSKIKELSSVLSFGISVKQKHE